MIGSAESSAPNNLERLLVPLRRVFQHPLQADDAVGTLLGLRGLGIAYSGCSLVAVLKLKLCLLLLIHFTQAVLLLPGKPIMRISSNARELQ